MIMNRLYLQFHNNNASASCIKNLKFGEVFTLYLSVVFSYGCMQAAGQTLYSAPSLTSSHHH